MIIVKAHINQKEEDETIEKGFGKQSDSLVFRPRISHIGSLH